MRRVLAGLAGLALVVDSASPSWGGTTQRVSVNSAGLEGNSISGRSSISDDGRFVAFEDDSENLVLGDLNGETDIFVHDLDTGATTRVSVASDGTEGNGDYTGLHGGPGPALSMSGRFVTFWSSSTNLVSGDTNDLKDIFVHDRQSGLTGRANLTSAGGQAEGISTAHSSHPSISGDGRYVVFDSKAPNLTPDDANGLVADVFVRDLEMGVTARVSKALDGGSGNGASQEPTLSANGRFVAFVSEASNLVPLDSNAARDVFVNDLDTDVTTRVSVASDGSEAEGESRTPSISADGRYVAFTSLANNLVEGDESTGWDLFVHDRETGTTVLASIATNGAQANGGITMWPALSADGRYVAFASPSDRLVPDDTNRVNDVFVRDLEHRWTVRVSVASDGSEANDWCTSPSISSEGPYVSFTCQADNLVGDDTNGWPDVFVYGPVPEPTAPLAASAALAALGALARRRRR